MLGRGLKPTPDLNQFCKQQWENYAQAIAETIEASHNHIVEDLLPSGQQVLFVRYENLRDNPKVVLDECFRFIFLEKSLKGSYLEIRINQAVEMYRKNELDYQLRRYEESITQSSKLFSNEVLTKIKLSLRSYNMFYFYYNSLF